MIRKEEGIDKKFKSSFLFLQTPYSLLKNSTFIKNAQKRNFDFIQNEVLVDLNLFTRM